MQLRWAILPSILLAPTVVAENSIEEICGSIKDVWSCSASITVPSGNPSLKMCPQKFFKVRHAIFCTTVDD